MDGLLEFLPIIAFIVYGIIRAVSGSDKKEQEQRKTNRPNVPKPTATPSGGQNNPKRTVYRTSGSEVYKEKEQKQHTPKQTVYTSTPTKVHLEEQQKQQIERFKDQMNTETRTSLGSLPEQDLSIGPTIQDAIKNHSLQNQNVNQERFKRDVKKGLNYKGLVNGIIMSEVLGSPRARKPYRSIVAERRRNIHYK
jgi:heme-binding NEAT domain protein